MKNIYGSYLNSRSYLSKFIYAIATNIITYLQAFDMYENKTSLIVHKIECIIIIESLYFYNIIVKIQRLDYPKFKINNSSFCLLVLFYHRKPYT